MEFSLRSWSSDDLVNLVKFANNAKIAENMTNKFPYPYTEENGKTFIEYATQANPLHIFAIDVNGEAVGGIGVHPQVDIMEKNAELGYWLGEPFWGNNIITRAIAQMVVYGFNTFNIDRIYARPFGTNIGSQKVLEKNGFIMEGRFEKIIYKNGKYLDELVYAVRRNEF